MGNVEGLPPPHSLLYYQYDLYTFQKKISSQKNKYSFPSCLLIMRSLSLKGERGGKGGQRRNNFSCTYHTDHDYFAVSSNAHCSFAVLSCLQLQYLYIKELSCNKH